MTIEHMIADTKRAVTQMNEVVSPGEATREYYREQGRQQEQARIVELLEAQFANSYWSDLSPDYLIALIKGDK